MKKLTSMFVCFIVIFISLFSFPVDSQAAIYEPNVKIYSDAYVLVNLDDDSYPVVAQKNPDMLKYPASLTKIVTAIVTIEKEPDLSRKVTVSKRAIESLYGTGAQVAGLKIGSKISIEQLLYLTMVHSACDACQVLAEAVSGSVEAFVEEMNKWVESIGCKNTHFVNPDGLHDENHYTTASDMAKISVTAIQNEIFDKISSTVHYEYDGVNFYHTNLMLQSGYLSYYYPYAKGIKTGSTEQAGYCVVTKASKGGYNYLVVVLDAPLEMIKGYQTKASFIDAASLFDWAFNSLKYETVVRKNDIAHEVPVENGKDADTVQLMIKQDVTALVPASFDASGVMIKPIDPPEVLEAPVAKDDVICKADVIYADKTVATVDLVAARTVELSTFLKILNALKRFFSNKIVIAVLVALVVFAILYVLIFIKRLYKDKQRIEARRREQEELDRELYGENDYYKGRK